MLSNQVLQNTIYDIAKITNAVCSIWNTDGRCLACTKEPKRVLSEKVLAFLGDADTCEELIEDGDAMFFIRDEEGPQYVLLLQGKVDCLEIAGRLGVSQLESLIRAYKARNDKNHFFQNLLLDNLLLVDVHNQAKRLKLEAEEGRIVFLIEPKREKDNIVIETLKGLYATGTRDFVTSVDEGHIILVKHVESTDSYQEMENVAKVLVDTLNAEAMVNVRVAYGTIVLELKDVSKSYKEAQMALDVGRIFYADKNILAYNALGIGRLIHQLPISLCEMFLKEVFDGRVVDQFEEETLSTVAKFFENNLNISETARQLYVHRNTLVYRLEKIQKTTGLDVRVFEDALTFKIALMVADHAKFIQKKETDR